MRRNPAKTRTASAAGRAHWTQRLVTEVGERLTVAVRAMRADVAGDPLLKGVLVSDAEVDALLARAGKGATPEYQSGSLAAVVADEGLATWLTLQERFALSGFEMDVLALCLGAEIEPRLERAFAYLNDDVNLKHPGLDTLLQLTAPGRLDLRAQLARDSRLLRFGLLVTPDAAHPRLLRLSEGVVRYLLEQDGLDPLLARAWCEADAAPLAVGLWQTRSELAMLADLVRNRAPRADAPPLVINLIGRAGSGRRHLAQAACRQAGLACLAIDAARLRRSGEAERTLTAALRDAVLLSAPLLLHHADELTAASEGGAPDLRAQLQSLLRELGWCLLLTSETSLGLAAWFPAARVVEVELPALSTAQREVAWQTVLSRTLPREERDELAAALAGKFRLTHGEIALAAQRLADAPAAPRNAAEWSAAAHRIAAVVAAPRLNQLAQPIAARHALNELVLPADRLHAFDDIVRRVRHRRRVLEDWVFDTVSSRGRGLVVLFFGPSGTGKTFAAEALAAALQMQLFRIDLAGVVSKYIGETEKNLRAIFDEADRADAVLFFDEADALFGKRSEVRDAHDRYANIEINYLLQRVESFEGIAILATNQRGHIDEAFLRRIHVSVEFPLPRIAERLGLWDRAFPEGAPLAADIDWEFLAKRFELTGGTIHNAALGAAYLAAAGGGEIGMAEIVNALRAELIKAGRRLADSEFGPYARLLLTPTVVPRATRLARTDHIAYAAQPAALA